MTEYIRSEWNGFPRLDFRFNGRDAILVCPHTPDPDGRWLLKTEYFGAFPAFEIEMLKRGYHLAYVSNITRWHVDDDSHVRAEFCRFLGREYGLNPRCVPVGMSCGGLLAVYFASFYPELVSVLYLDAPVLNYLSCPCAVGGSDPTMYDEFVRHKGMTVHDLINYRNHPIDNVGKLIAAGIPVALVCGDSDQTVPYRENGLALSEMYRAGGVPFFEVLKPGCGHHPHGLEDNTALIEFVERYYL